MTFYFLGKPHASLIIALYKRKSKWKKQRTNIFAIYAIMCYHETGFGFITR
jgi:hypothetical protein